MAEQSSKTRPPSKPETGAARKPRGHMLQPPTTVVSVENTHNRAGGVVWTAVESLAITAIARELELATFLDGARLWNAAIALV